MVYAAAGEAVTIVNDGANITLSGTATGTFPTTSVNQFTATDPIYTAGQSLTFAAGAALTLAAGLSSTGVESVTFDNRISTKILAITATDVNSSAAGAIAVSTSATVNVTGTASTLTGVISGAGSFTKDGPGTIVIAGINTYSARPTSAREP